MFPKTRTGVIKKTVPAIMTIAAATDTVIPNLTPEELVKFMDVAVASKYRNDLTNFTHIITEEVRSTIDTFKIDLQKMLPRQIRSVVQQVHGESLLPVKTHRGAVSQQHEEPGSPRCRRWSPVTSELQPARLAHTRRDGSRACHLVCTWPGR
jgi:hypothetical protein